MTIRRVLPGAARTRLGRERQPRRRGGRIAKGAKPGDLAVERATTVELIVNLATAASIGLVVPVALLARAADDVLR